MLTYGLNRNGYWVWGGNGAGLSAVGLIGLDGIYKSWTGLIVMDLDPLSISNNV